MLKKLQSYGTLAAIQYTHTGLLNTTFNFLTYNTMILELDNTF